MNSDVNVGEVYEHPCGLAVRVISQRVPGDRYDDLPVWCEVVTGARAGDIIYGVGHRDSWCMVSQYGWKKRVS